MRIAGLGCLGCGGVLGLLGVLGFVAVMIPGVINYSARLNVMAPSGALCGAAVMVALFGLILVLAGGRRAPS